SGTLIAAWGREHGSRLQFAAWLHGVSEAELAQRFGIDLGGRSLAFADQLDTLAERCEDFADGAEKCSGAEVRLPDPTEVPERVAITTVNAKGEAVESVTWRSSRWVA